MEFLWDILGIIGGLLLALSGVLGYLAGEYEEDDE